MIDKEKLSDMFVNALFDSDEGTNQTNFLNSRSFSKDTIYTWKVGYCPPHVKYRPFPFLRGRIIVPCYDVYGNLLSFFGRKLESDAEKVLKNFCQDYEKGLDIFYAWDKAKWINEPYEKSKNLFGLNLTKKNIIESGYAIVVEGNFDVISMFDNGIKNCVATCGSQVFSEYHIALLLRYTDTIVIMSDKDESGDKAQTKIKQMLSLYTNNIYNCILPRNKDPEDFIRNNTKDINSLIKDRIKDREKEIVL